MTQKSFAKDAWNYSTCKLKCCEKLGKTTSRHDFFFQEGTCFEINALQRYQFSFSLMSNVEISHTVTNKISFLICIHINNSGFLNINVRKKMLLLLYNLAFWNYIVGSDSTFPWNIQVLPTKSNVNKRLPNISSRFCFLHTAANHQKCKQTFIDFFFFQARFFPKLISNNKGGMSIRFFSPSLFSYRVGWFFSGFANSIHTSSSSCIVCKCKNFLSIVFFFNPLRSKLEEGYRTVRGLVQWACQEVE